MLEKYSSCSGQFVNVEKSAISFSNNTSLEIRNGICQVLDGVKEQRSTRYLGMSFVIERSKKKVFGYLVEAVQRRVGNWKAKFLSTTGMKFS